MNGASKSYSWLQGRGYVGGSNPQLIQNGSCLSWFGGNMPPAGPASDPQAESDMKAWAAAGGQNN
jgi:hypothetical protein